MGHNDKRDVVPGDFALLWTVMVGFAKVGATARTPTPYPGPPVVCPRLVRKDRRLRYGVGRFHSGTPFRLASWSIRGAVSQR